MNFIDSIVAADKSATLAVNSVHCPASDWIWTVFSDKEIWFVLYLVVLVFFFIRLGWKKALLAFGCCVLMVVCCDQFANLIKNFVERQRPCNDDWMIANGIHILEQGGGFSFFSAHAANTFGFAACSSMCFKWDRKRSYKAYTAGIFIWAALVSVSRVFVACHFIGDILVGTAVGLILGWAIAFAGGKAAAFFNSKERE